MTVTEGIARPTQVRAVVPAKKVKFAKTVSVGKPTEHSIEHGEPRVEMIREDDVVKAIDVICPCGHRIRLHCDYD